MKILHICMAQYSDGWSYQENLLAKYHKKSGHDVWLITSEYCYQGGKLVKDTKDEFDDINGVHIIRLKSKGLFNKIPLYESFTDTVELIYPDLIFSHGCQYVDVLKLRNYLKKNPKCKLLVDNHADFSNSATNWISKNILHKILWKFCAKKIDSFVLKWYGVMPSRVDFIKEIYGIPSEKVKLLVMGADDEKVTEAENPKIRAEIRSKLNISDDDFLIMTGGKIDTAKKQTIFLMEAVNKLTNPKVKLVVFGSVIPELMSKVKENCSDSVQYIGWVPSDDSYKYFASADLVVFPGRHSVFWEQVSGLGIPMLCKYWEGTTHIDVGGNVKFLYKDSADEMCEVIGNIITDKKEFDNMRRIASVKGKSVFSYLNIAKKSLEV